MITVEKLKKEHVKELIGKDRAPHIAEHMTEQGYEMLENLPDGWTIMSDGQPIATGGAVPFHRNRAELWMIIDQSCGKYFISVHKIVSRLIRSMPYPRLEATVDLSFPQGHRWMKLLGFELEAPVMKAYGLAGNSCSLYSKVRAE